MAAVVFWSMAVDRRSPAILLRTELVQGGGSHPRRQCNNVSSREHTKKQPISLLEDAPYIGAEPRDRSHRNARTGCAVISDVTLQHSFPFRLLPKVTGLVSVRGMSYTCTTTQSWKFGCRWRVVGTGLVRRAGGSCSGRGRCSCRKERRRRVGCVWIYERRPGDWPTRHRNRRWSRVYGCRWSRLCLRIT